MAQLEISSHLKRSLKSAGVSPPSVTRWHRSFKCRLEAVSDATPLCYTCEGTRTTRLRLGVIFSQILSSERGAVTETRFSLWRSSRFDHWPHDASSCAGVDNEANIKQIIDWLRKSTFMPVQVILKRNPSSAITPPENAYNADVCCARAYVGFDRQISEHCTDAENIERNCYIPRVRTPTQRNYFRFTVTI